MIFFGNILLYLFETYPVYLKYTFIGLILGSIPAFLQSIKSEKTSQKSSSFFLTILAFGIAIFLVYLEKSNFLTLEELTAPSSFYLFFSGIIMSIGIVVPGVSSTVLLMLLGVYPTYLSAVSNLTLTILIPLGLGVIIGGVLFLLLLKYLMKHYYSQTFHFILGFTLGSIFVIFPGFHLTISYLLAIGLMIISIYITYSLTEKE